MTKENIGLLRLGMLSLVLRVPAAITNRLIRWRFPTVEQRSVGFLLFARGREVPAFIDVRGMMPGQVCAHVASHRLHHPHGRVALVCDIGYCSSKIAAALVSAGFSDVVNLEGGLRALRQFGHTVDRYVAQRTA